MGRVEGTDWACSGPRDSTGPGPANRVKAGSKPRFPQRPYSRAGRGALNFSENEMIALDASTSDSANLPGDRGLSLLLKHISGIPAFNKDDFLKLEPGIVRLMRKHGSEDYRFYPIRLDLWSTG